MQFGICTASGDGVYDAANADVWLDICDQNNLSYACWAISNSEESAAYFWSTCEKKAGGWLPEDLTNTSRYLINRYDDRLIALASQEESEEPTVEEPEETIPSTDNNQPSDTPSLSPDEDAAKTGDHFHYMIFLLCASSVLLAGSGKLIWNRRKMK